VSLTWSEFIDRKGNMGIDFSCLCEEIHFSAEAAAANFENKKQKILTTAAT